MARMARVEACSLMNPLQESHNPSSIETLNHTFPGGEYVTLQFIRNFGDRSLCFPYAYPRQLA